MRDIKCETNWRILTLVVRDIINTQRLRDSRPQNDWDPFDGEGFDLLVISIV